MKCFLLIASLGLLALLSSCVSTKKIAEGYYKFQDEKIDVAGNAISMRVKVTTPTGSRLIERKGLRYFVDESGKITWSGLTSNEMLNGVGQFDWKYVASSTILKKNLKTQETSRFTLSNSTTSQP